MTFIIVHRWGENTDSDWYPWLSNELKNQGHIAIVPQMPETEEPKIEAWVNMLKQVVEQQGREVNFIGHSIGCQTILRSIEQLNKEQVGYCYFVAPWLKLKPDDLDVEDKRIASPWENQPILDQKIVTKVKKMFCLFSDNDPYVALENVEWFKERFRSQTYIFKNKGHFSSEDKINNIPELLSLISSKETL